MRSAILAAREQRDSVGGVVECIAQGLPAGLGGPLFGGMEGRLSAALFGIPAVKGVEFGAGFQAAALRGSQHNDPYEVRDGRVVTQDGQDVTSAYHLGAQKTLELALAHGCTAAVLKERSPSCGCGQIYDGTFTHQLIEGSGITAQLLLAHGISVYGESKTELLSAPSSLSSP